MTLIIGEETEEYICLADKEPPHAAIVTLVRTGKGITLCLHTYNDELPLTLEEAEFLGEVLVNFARF